MKTITISMFLFFSTLILNAQVDMKGIMVGETNTGPIYVNESLGGIDGTIIVNKINDNRVCQLMFMPTDGENIKRIHNVDVTKLVNGIKNKYNIPKLDKSYPKEYDDDKYHLHYQDDDLDVTYFISVDGNEFLEPPVAFTFIITNDNLYSIKQKEEQEKANEDF